MESGNMNINCENKSSHSKENPQSTIDCFTNLIPDETVEQVIDTQRNMLSKFEKANEMLVNCNALAMIRFENANKDLKKYTQQLTDLKKDLDSVFRRIRFLKFKLSQQYPEAFKACSNVFNVLDEEEETEDIKSENINENVT